MCGRFWQVPAKGADKHYQRALGQMEVSHQRVNTFELITGVNKNIRPIVILADLAFGGADRLKRAAAGGADGDCPFAVCLDGFYQLGCFFRYAVML